MTAPRTFLAIVLVAVVGVALKIDRYRARGEAGGAAAQTQVATIMGAHGWSAAQSSNDTAAAPYPLQVFVRAGCGAPVVVALLDGNAESATFFRLQHGGDAGFMQQGLVAHPGGLERQVSGLLDDLQRFAGAPQRRQMPVLAIAPAPVAEPEPCQGPPASAWQRRPAEILTKP